MPESTHIFKLESYFLFEFIYNFISQQEVLFFVIPFGILCEAGKNFYK